MSSARGVGRGNTPSASPATHAKRNTHGTTTASTMTARNAVAPMASTTTSATPSAAMRGQDAHLASRHCSHMSSTAFKKSATTMRGMEARKYSTLAVTHTKGSTHGDATTTRWAIGNTGRTTKWLADATRQSTAANAAKPPTPGIQSMAELAATETAFDNTAINWWLPLRRTSHMSKAHTHSWLRGLFHDPLSCRQRLQ